MNDTALAALFRAMFTRLTQSNSIWVDRVYSNLVPNKIVRPYVLYFLSGGGEANDSVTRDAEFVITVKCVSSPDAVAYQGAALLADRLNDSGEFDNGTPMNAGSEWRIKTTSQEGAIDLLELVDGQQVRHAGFQLRVTMDTRL